MVSTEPCAERALSRIGLRPRLLRRSEASSLSSRLICQHPLQSRFQIYFHVWVTREHLGGLTDYANYFWNI